MRCLLLKHQILITAPQSKTYARLGFDKQNQHSSAGKVTLCQSPTQRKVKELETDVRSLLAGLACRLFVRFPPAPVWPLDNLLSNDFHSRMRGKHSQVWASVLRYRLSRPLLDNREQNGQAIFE